MLAFGEFRPAQAGTVVSCNIVDLSLEVSTNITTDGGSESAGCHSTGYTGRDVTSNAAEITNAACISAGTKVGGLASTAVEGLSWWDGLAGDSGSSVVVAHYLRTEK